MTATLPATAQRLADLASEHGWDVEVAHGLGDSESVALVLRRDGVKLAGIWEKGRWRSGIGFGRYDGKGPLTPTTRLNQGDVKRVVTG